MSDENEPSTSTKICLEETSCDMLSQSDILSLYACFYCQIAFTLRLRNKMKHLLYVSVNPHELGCIPNITQLQ
jgi:hypothetical protein